MPKRIVICCDGTWNTPDQKDGDKVCPSNVAKTALSINTGNPGGVQQLVYYDKGVGTEWYDRLRGGMSGMGISKNIQQAYAYLVENYEADDEVYFFGFSRGAYTVRSTVGLIRNSGLLKREHAGKLKDAFKLYRSRKKKDHPNAIEAALFRQTYSREIEIKFLGVWDTVGALGIPVKNFDLANKALNALNDIEFHDVELSGIVKNAFQALAIDERRAAFEPSIWVQPKPKPGQHLEQAWFVGVHSNIGGGYQCSRLSDCAFEWMRDRAKQCDLVFKTNEVFADYKITVTEQWDGWDGVLRDSKTGVYKLIKDYVRPIGVEKIKGDDGKEILRFSEVQAVHGTAVKRFNNSQKPPEPYQPENLKKYLSTPGAKIVPPPG